MYKTAILLVAALLAACSQNVEVPTTELNVQTHRLERQHADIEAVIGDLTLQYLSESEHPWTYDPVPKLSFEAWFALWESQQIEQRRTFRYFFKQLENPLYTNVDAERYAQLERVLRRHLNHLTVYWVTDLERPYEVQVVVLGQNRYGVFALSTLSIET